MAPHLMMFQMKISLLIKSVINFVIALPNRDKKILLHYRLYHSESIFIWMNISIPKNDDITFNYVINRKEYYKCMVIRGLRVPNDSFFVYFKITLICIIFFYLFISAGLMTLFRNFVNDGKTH